MALRDCLALVVFVADGSLASESSWTGVLEPSAAMGFSDHFGRVSAYLRYAALHSCYHSSAPRDRNRDSPCTMKLVLRLTKQ
jgi:hypothetical protein